jgi:hypothetical protein
MGKRAKSRREKLNSVFVYLGLFVGFAGWGYAVDSAYGASLLFLLSLGFLLAAWWEYFEFKVHTKVVVMILVLTGFVVGDSKWIAYVTAPSFPYVKSGALLNPQQPNSFWSFMIVNRGRNTLYNVSVHFQDMDRTDLIRKALQQNPPSSDIATLLQSDTAEFHYVELDPNTTGGIDNEVAHFFWTPAFLSDEHYDVLLTHRNGTFREKLNIKKIGTQWQYAMRVTDEGSHVILIECRDPKFPTDSEWKRELPKCFPDFPTAN